MEKPSLWWTLPESCMRTLMTSHESGMKMRLEFHRVSRLEAASIMLG